MHAALAVIGCERCSVIIATFSIVDRHLLVAAAPSKGAQMLVLS
jgi:hypothetical protein